MTGPYGAFALPDPAPRSGWAPVSASPLRRLAGGLVRRDETRPGTTLLQCAPTAEAAPYHSRLAELCRRAGVDTGCIWSQSAADWIRRPG